MSTLKRFGAALALCFCFSLGVSISNRAIADIGSLVQGVVSTGSSGMAVKPLVQGIIDTSNNVEPAKGSVTGVPYSALTHTDGTPLTTTTGVKLTPTDNSTTGSITANGQSVTVSTVGCSVAGVFLSAGWTGTVQPEISFDGGTTYAVRYFFSVGGGGPPQLQQSGVSSASGSYYLECAGATNARVRAIAAMTGTLNVTLQARLGPAVGQQATVHGMNTPGVSVSGVVNPLLLGAVDTSTVARWWTLDLPTNTSSTSTYYGQVRTVPGWTGAQANAWNGASVGINGTSTALDTFGLRHIDAFGNVSAATTISLQVSQDNATFYDATATTGVGGNSVVLAGAGNFAISFDVAARYVRLKSSAAATITATLAGKG